MWSISIFSTRLTRKMRQLSAWMHASDLNVSDLVIETWQTASCSLYFLCAFSITWMSTQQTSDCVWYVVLCLPLLGKHLSNIDLFTKRCSSKPVNVHWLYILVNLFERFIWLPYKAKVRFLPSLFALYILYIYVWLDNFSIHSSSFAILGHLCELIISR